MQRNKTQRKRIVPTPTPDVPIGPFVGDTVAKATEDSLDAFLYADQVTFNQPWQKLDRGARLDRLRKFVQAYPNLSPAEMASLLAAVLHAFETRQLNTKLAVDYDPVMAKVQSVRGLKERVTLSGLKTFRIESPTMRATVRRAPKKENVENTEVLATSGPGQQVLATSGPGQQVLATSGPGQQVLNQTTS